MTAHSVSVSITRPTQKKWLTFESLLYIQGLFGAGFEVRYAAFGLTESHSSL